MSEKDSKKTTATEDDPVREWKVITDMVSVDNGLKPNGKVDVIRLLNGDTIMAPSSDERIITLRNLASIVPVEKWKPGMRIRPMGMVKRLGGEDVLGAELSRIATQAEVENSGVVPLNGG